MKRFLWLMTFLSSLIVLSACSSGIKAESMGDIAGTWYSPSTTMQFTVSIQKNVVHIHAWDNNDGEVFEISDVSWDGTTLKATFLMPSTQHRTTALITKVSEDELSDKYSGDAEGSMSWYRKKADQ